MLEISYFERVEALLRRSLGVSTSAKASVHVRPAPPTAMGPLDEPGVKVNIVDDDEDDDASGTGGAGQPEEWLDWHKLKAEMAEGKADRLEEVMHDEL